ncbi:efflux RND transporter periplasmic adaptor subunit [Serratia microhaemolytica]|uniref:efflux RND transporter periplasmic adaptor subunit n=1 Tax=Serratia microhaemolytica TaxID=2675110 RepID=UPI001392430F|nr:efflux RND transporter periplasmic adaptor subunit [Serratia microhaemolytica]
MSVSKPELRKLTTRATLMGAWRPREEVSLSSVLEGIRVTEILVEESESVKSGQVLARLERTVLDSQMRQAEQTVQRINAELTQVSEQYERTKKLFAANATSQYDYEAALTALLTTQASLRQAEAARDEHQARLAYTDIVAPFAGIITQRTIQLGTIVNTQTPLFRLADSQSPDFVAEAPQRLLSNLLVGMAAEITTNNIEGRVTGTIRRLSRELNPNSGYGQLRITTATVPAAVRFGSVGRAHIKLAEHQVIAVDIRALRYDSKMSGQNASEASQLSGQSASAAYVFVVDEHKQVRRTPVKIGIQENGWVEIINGLDTNSLVVVTGSTLLQDGDKIELEEAETIEPSSVLRPVTGQLTPNSTSRSQFEISQHATVITASRKS